MLLTTFTRPDRLEHDLFSKVHGAIGAAVDIRRDGDRYVIDADLPGVDPGSVEVTVEADSLTIRAERSKTSTKEESQWLVHERSATTFVRSFTLGDGIDPDGVKADFHDGVLTVVVPIAAGSRHHKITVTEGFVEHKAPSDSTSTDSPSTDEGKGLGRVFARVLRRLPGTRH